jgi:hypothetical protein
MSVMVADLALAQAPSEGWSHNCGDGIRVATIGR